MTLRLGAGLRDQLVTQINSMISVNIYAGPQPADPETQMDVGTELATLYLSGMSAPMNGYTTLGAPVEAVATNTGTAGWARWSDSNRYYGIGSVASICIDGACGLVGTPNVEFILSDINIVAGNPVRLTAFSLTFPM